MGQCKKDITPLLTPRSYVFCALTHRFKFHQWYCWALCILCYTGTRGLSSIHQHEQGILSYVYMMFFVLSLTYNIMYWMILLNHHTGIVYMCIHLRSKCHEIAFKLKHIKTSLLVFLNDELPVCIIISISMWLTVKGKATQWGGFLVRQFAGMAA